MYKLFFFIFIKKICFTLILVDLRPILKNFFYINLCCKNIWCNLQRKKVGHNPQCYCNLLHKMLQSVKIEKKVAWQSAAQSL